MGTVAGSVESDSQSLACDAHPSLWEVLSGEYPLRLIVLLALVIRLSASYFSDFFVDEAFSFGIASGPLDSIVFGVRGDSHPPLFNLSLVPLAHFTRSTVLLRLPSVVCSVLALLVNFRLFRRFVSRESAYAVVSIMSVSYCCWLSDSQMRMYGYAELLTSLMVEMLVLSIEVPTWKPSGRALFSVWLTLLLLPLVHFISAFLQGLSWLWLTLKMRRSPLDPRLGLPMSLGLVAGVGWVMYAAGDPSKSHILVHSLNQHQLFVPWELLNFFTGWISISGLPGLRDFPGVFYDFGLVIASVSWIFVFLGIRRLAQQGRDKSVYYIVFISLVCVGALMSGAYVRGAKWLQLRHMLVLGPYLLVSLSYGAARFGIGARYLLGLTLGLNLFVAAAFPGDPFWWNQNWTGPARFIEKNSRPGDLIFAHNWYSLLGLDYCLWGGGIQIPLVNYGQYSIQIPPGTPITQQIPLEFSSLTLALEKTLEGRRCFLVLNQVSEPRIREWFLQRGSFVDAFKQTSFSSWGATEVLLLQFPNTSKSGSEE